MVFDSVYFLKNDGTIDLLYSPDERESGRVLSKASVTFAVNEASKFSFSIHPTHPLYGLIEPNKGSILIKRSVNGDTEKIIFRGKVREVKVTYQREKQCTAYGGLGWLDSTYYARTMATWSPADSATRESKGFITKAFPKDASVREMISRVIRNHNWQIGDTSDENNFGDFNPSKIALGQLRVAREDELSDTYFAQENPYGVNVKKTAATESDGTFIQRKQNSLVKTMDWIKSEIVEKCQSNIIVDEENGVIYPYGAYTPADNSQELRLEENILDINFSEDYSNVPTIFLPIGQSNQTTGSVLKSETTEGDVPADVTMNSYDLTANDTTAERYITVDDDGKGAIDYDPEMFYTPISADENGLGKSVEIHSNDDESEEIRISSGENDGVATFNRTTKANIADGITFSMRPPFIVWEEGLRDMGYVYGTKQWSNATKIRLRAYGPAYFKRLIVEAKSVEIRAIDKGYIDSQLKSSIRLGYRYHVVSQLHNLDTWIPCTKMEIDILNPVNTKYTFSSNRRKLTSTIGTLIRRVNKATSSASTTHKTLLLKGSDRGAPTERE